MRLRTRGAIASLAVGIIALALGTAPALAADDPALDQTVGADEEASTESAVIDTGHVDIGPRMVDGQWSVALRDDSGAHPVWRDPDRTVLRVSDAALMAAPTGSDYAFMGAQAGEQYYVVPQTQNPNVVWLGWNTQDPGVVSAIDRGATMRIGSVSGPGRTWMFLQDGTFGKPRLLVDGQSGQAQDVWVDASTHVHANWVFTAPGVYTAALTFSARTTDGREVSASTTLRFAVGSQTSADEAFAAAPAGTAEAGAAGSAGGGGSAAGAGPAGDSALGDDGTSANEARMPAGSSADGTGLSDQVMLIIALVVAASITVALGAVLIMRSRSIAAERRKAIAEADGAEGMDGAEGDAEADGDDGADQAAGAAGAGGVRQAAGAADADRTGGPDGAGGADADPAPASSKEGTR
ncbi:putative membrane protein [Schaalia georgiae F0490]|uniref:Putative membrane protein n=1 Tax=Schaalia georgiae F0490 TaxID=1125717 RepID=J1GQZ8_9ACTO|nr:choice-of-anchor M domain-containing protein [Schaalia georgiae]EJF35333.1 putative membrane protein [Schaalia georgiae F0490]